MSILVVGSFVTDLIARTKRAPEAGETVVGTSFHTSYGGKGANQAVAAKKMGQEVIMAGSVGNDSYGDSFIKLFEELGFDSKYIYKSKNATGCSVVVIDEAAQNRIVMTPGANLDFPKERLLALEEIIKKVDIVVCQFEMADEIVPTIAMLTKKHHKRFILNPAPAKAISDEVLASLSVITPNETELGIIVGKKLETINDYIAASESLLAKGVENVVVTLGVVGSLLVNKDGAYLQKAFKVKAIDTVGAGDSFTGSLAALLDEGYQIKDALRIASAVAALEVTREGAIKAMPTREEVFSFLAEQE